MGPAVPLGKSEIGQDFVAVAGIICGLWRPGGLAHALVLVGDGRAPCIARLYEQEHFMIARHMLLVLEFQQQVLVWS